MCCKRRAGMGPEQHVGQQVRGPRGQCWPDGAALQRQHGPERLETSMPFVRPPPPPTWRAPVQPSGWPSAMAPPLGLTRSMSSPSLSTE